MPSDNPDSSSSPRRGERRLVWLLVVLLVLYRSVLFVFSSWTSFDSDEGVFGLMAKHLAEGRAFPLFMYGQSYILAVEAWLAAPLFILFGPSAAALKLPLLAINVGVGLVLVHLLERECGLRPVLALVASLFFVLPPPGTVAALLSASGGNVEPFLYVLLLWMTRRRPVWFGLVAGLGFLQREFTMYGVAAVLLVQAVDTFVARRDGWRALFQGLRVAAEAWLVVQVLRPFASAAGPGTTIAALGQAPANDLAEILRRSCMQARSFSRGVENLAVHWSELFGTARVHAHRFGIDTAAVQGLPGLRWVLGAAAIGMAASAVAGVERPAAWWERSRFAIYLLLIGVASATLYVVARCGTLSPMRYDLLSLVGATGLTALCLQSTRGRWFTCVVVAVVVGWAAISAVPHGRMWVEHVRGRPAGPKVQLIQQLEAHGVRYAEADYWIAYAVTFLSNERVIVASTDVERIPAYNREVEAHRAEAVRISRTRCGEGPEVASGLFLCPY